MATTTPPRSNVGRASGLPHGDVAETPVQRPAWVRSLFPYIEFALALLAAAMWYTQGGAVWYAGSWPGPWPLLLLGLAWVLRLVRVGFSGRPVAMDLFLWLFLVSAAVGVWAAHDRGPAWAVFWLLVGAVGLFYAVAGQPDETHHLVILAFWGFAGAALSLYFLATHDWSTDAAKVPLLAQLGRQIQALLPSMPGHRLSPNVAGGLLATLLPFYVPLVWSGLRQAGARRILGLAHPWARLWTLFWALMAGVAALGWVISMSRGAWMGLLAATALWALWRGAGWWSRKLHRDPQHAWRLHMDILLALLALGLVAALGLAALILAGRLPGADSLSNRLNLFRDALLLARDYRLIGAGLGMFQSQFAIYTLLIHVGYIIYSHNMLLSILIAQGYLGLIPYLGLVVSTVTLALRQLRRLETQASGLPNAGVARASNLPSTDVGQASGLPLTNSSLLIEAALASLAVVLIHGLVDDVLYGSRGALLLFLPCALVAAAAHLHQSSALHEPQTTRRRTLLARRRKRRIIGLLAALVVLVSLGIAWRTLAGAWYANLGALEQARVELQGQDPLYFQIDIDRVRQQVNLDQPRRLLTRAKEIDPRNPTARQRLASIDLSLGRYPEALAEMQAAWDAGHRDSVTRLLYGDALVAAGQPQRAAEVLHGLTWAETRLLGQAWSRYWEDQDYRRAADAWATVSLLDPSNTTAAQSRAEAEKRLGDSQ